MSYCTVSVYIKEIVQVSRHTCDITLYVLILISYKLLADDCIYIFQAI